MKLSAGSELVYNVTCSEEEVLDGSGAIVLLKLVLALRAFAASACSSFVSTSVSGVAIIPCCTWLSALGMSSAAS